MKRQELPVSTVCLRFADLVGALSLATDAAAGAPPETSLRTCLLAAWIGHRASLSAEEERQVYWGTALRHIGCTSWSHEAAAIAAGDDHDLLRTFEGTDRARKGPLVRRVVTRLARDKRLFERAGAVARALAAPRAGAALASAHCAQASTLAGDIGLDEGVQRVLEQIYERWDGKGLNGLAGAELAPAARVLHVAQTLESLVRRVGLAAAVIELEGRAGSSFDPALVRVVAEGRGEIAGVIATDGLWERFLVAEPGAARSTTVEGIDAVVVAFGRYADLKVPARIGHSALVARLVADACEAVSATAAERTQATRAAHLHDLGVVAVPNGVWERQGGLGVGGWEAVRLHAYHSERVVGRSAALAELAPIIGGHHERLDGSGYHRGARAATLDRPTRLLAAADAYAAMTEDRPHRGAFPRGEAARRLRAAATDGQLCRMAVDAILAGDGASPKKRLARWPSGLTEREAQVLARAARGETNKEIAKRLSIAARTVRHHLEHVYEKTGARTRAAAALFALRNGLVPHVFDER